MFYRKKKGEKTFFLRRKKDCFGGHGFGRAGEIERKVFCQTPSKERHIGEMGNNT